jgi:hypothetical protein
MNRIALAALLVASPVFAQGRAEAIVVLADDGALDAPAVRAIQSVAASELRKRGVSVSDDRRTGQLRGVDDKVSTLVIELGARRVFALRVGGRLGQKIPLSFEELSPGSLTPVYSASLTAVGLEECDVVTARLVDAVLDRRSAESTAEMGTVTAMESKPFAKKPGERFWFIGLPVALFNADKSNNPFGFTIGYGYEAESFRVSASAGGYGRASQGVGYLVLEAAWIPLQGEFSPYLGGGLGYMGANNSGGMGAIVEGGIEAFRLHGVRGLLGVEVAIPFFSGTYNTYNSTTLPSRSVFPAAFVRLAF